MTRTAFGLRNIDDYLGPAETRFFSRGYQRAEYDIHDLVVRPGTDGAAATTALVDIRYPRDWSVKDQHADLRPHLSTIDVFVLGVQLAELHLAHTFGLSAADRQVAWLRRVTIRAGDAPQEELTGLACSATPRAHRPAAGAEDATTTMDCRIGAMRVRCEFVHPAGTGAARTARYDDIVDALGDPRRQFFGAGFKERRHTVTDVQVDLERLRCDARVRLGGGPQDATPLDGTEGAYQPGVSMIDCFVVSLQLAQVLLYELDTISRRESETLWMIRTTLEAATPVRPAPAVLDTTTEVTASHLVPLRGRTWRNVDLASELGGVTLRCSFAHQLPETDRQ